MRTVRFNTHDEDAAADAIAKMLLDLPRSRKDRNYVKFNQVGAKFTIAWRYPDGTWGVTFRNPPTARDQRRAYDNPVEAARAIVVGKHPPFRKQDLADVDVTAELLADRSTVCEPGDTGCVGLTALT